MDALPISSIVMINHHYGRSSDLVHSDDGRGGGIGVITPNGHMGVAFSFGGQGGRCTEPAGRGGNTRIFPVSTPEGMRGAGRLRGKYNLLLLLPLRTLAVHYISSPRPPPAPAAPPRHLRIRIVRRDFVRLVFLIYII